MREERERGHAVERTPAARVAQQLGQDPGIEQRPRRQQDERVRDAAVVEQVLDRTGEGDHEVEVGRRAGEEPRGDAARQRVRRRVLRRRRPGEQRARQCVSERVHKWGQTSLFRYVENEVCPYLKPSQTRS